VECFLPGGDVAGLVDLTEDGEGHYEIGIKEPKMDNETIQEDSKVGERKQTMPPKRTLKSRPAGEGKAEECSRHNAPLKCYCTKCGEPVCRICIQLDHGDHDTVELSDIIQSKIEEVKDTIQVQEEELKKQRNLKHLLTELKCVASPLDEQDILIKDIEGHTEECMNKMIKWKERLKADVKAKYVGIKQLRKDMDVALEAVSESIKKAQPQIAKATKLLSVSETLHLDELTNLQHNLEATASACNASDGEKYRDLVHETEGLRHTFVPEELPSSLGNLKEIRIENVFEEPSKIFQHTLKVDSEDQFIRCVANLGEKFAVAHPTRKGEPSDVVDIYEIPGTFKLTLRAGVGPVHDMSATPDGHLAILSDGTKGSSCCSVKVFDPDTGAIKSICDLKISKPISLGVNWQNQYVILSGKEQEQKLITIVNEDGNSELECVIKSGSVVSNPQRITCGWKYIFVLGQKEIGIYEMKGKRLVFQSIITEETNLIGTGAKDISASLLDRLFLADSYGIDIYMNRCIENDNKTDWGMKSHRVHNIISAAGTHIRISVGVCYIIMSCGQTFTVYRY
jgi:hypothetical protein